MLESSNSFVMALKFNLAFVVMMAATCMVFVEARLQTDVQTEIRLIKEEIVDIKRMEDLTQVTIKAFDSRVNGVDSRVSDLSKETSLFAATVQRVSDREAQHHEEAILQREKIENIEHKTTMLSEKVRDVSTKEGELEQQSRAVLEKIELLAKEEELMKLKNHTEEIETQADEKVQEVKHQTDEKVQSLRQTMEMKLKNRTEAIETQIDKKVQEAKQEAKHRTDEKVQEVKRQSDEKVQEVKRQTDKKVQSLTQTVEMLTGQLQEFKQRGIVDALHPIGSIYITFTKAEPPKNGEYGVKWEKLPKGYVLMSADDLDVGAMGGSQRIDGGYTEGHSLTVSQMPSHSHSYNHYYKEHGWSSRGGDYEPFYTETTATSSTGGNEAHSHALDIKNHKCLVWKRTA